VRATPLFLGTVVSVTSLCTLCGPTRPAFADEGSTREDGLEARGPLAPRPYCASELTELADGLCVFDGGTPDDGRKTLVVYLHGALKDVPGAAYLQQRAMVFHAKREHFTVLFAAAPESGGFRAWPRSPEAQAAQEEQVVVGLSIARKSIERQLGRPFDETFVAGFSSGAYYAGSLALRGVLPVDGYLIFAGGNREPTPIDDASRRAPVFVGVSAADPGTANGTRTLGGQLADLDWPSRTEEQNAGHLVDWTLMNHGVAWLRAQKDERERRALRDR
jgi:predicted esterase